MNLRFPKTHNSLPALTLACLMPLGLAACDKKDTQKTDDTTAKPDREKLLVCTTFYPTTYFAERIAGDKIDVVCPCPPDADPAFWLPDAKAIETYQDADLIVVNGASFEKWLGKVTLPESRIVDTTKPLAAEFIVLHDAVTHSHGPEGAHTHEGVDGHTWLDPISAKTQASEIKNALVKKDATNKETYEAGFEKLAADFDALDARFKALSPRMGDETLVCNHPAYNYLGRRYGWKVQSFHLDPEAMPDDKTFEEIKTYKAEHPASFVLWEAEPLPEIVERFRKDLGLKSIVFSPCEGLEPDELANKITFFSVMNDNIDRMEKAFPAKAQGEDNGENKTSEASKASEPS